MVVRTVTGFVAQQKARVQKEARERRARQLTLVAQRKTRKKLRKLGFRPTKKEVAARAGKFEVIGGKVVKLKVEAPKLFDISGKRAKPREELIGGRKVLVTKGFSKADLVKIRAKQASAEREAKRAEERAKSRGIVTKTPSAKIVLSQLEQALPKREARKEKVLKLPVTQVFEANLRGQKTFQLKSGKRVSVPGIVSRADIKKAERAAIGRVAAKGQEAKVAKVAERIAVARLKTEAKEVRAVEKAEVRVKGLNRFNKAVSGAVDRVFDTFAGKKIEGDFKSGFKTVKGPARFEEQAARQATKVIAAFSPPSVAANIIGTGLVAKDLGEAGIIKKVGVKAAQATFGSLTPTGVRKAIKGLKNLDEQDFIKVKNKTVRLVSRLGKNIDPKTPVGLGNLIGLAAIFRADKAASAGTKKLLAAVKKSPGVKNLRVEVDRTVRALIRSKKAQARLTPSRVTKVKAPKRLGKALKRGERKIVKAERRKAQFERLEAKIPKKQQVLKIKIKKEEIKLKEFEKFLPIGKKAIPKKKVIKVIEKLERIPKKPSPPRQTEIFRKAARKERRIERRFKQALKEGKAAVIFDKTTGKRLTVPGIKQISNTIRKAADKEVRAGKSFLLTQQKSNLVRGAPKKSQQALKIKVKREAVKSRQERFVPTSDVVNRDLRPEKLYGDLIIPETVASTKGWRPGTKSKVLAQIKKQQDVLKKQRLSEFKAFRNRLDTVLKTEYKTVSERNRIEGKLLEKFLSPKFSKKDILSVVKDKAVAAKFDKSLKALSIINFKIDFADKIKFNVDRIPISKKKVAIRPGVKEQVISEVVPKRRIIKKPVRKVVKPKKKVVKVKALVKPKLRVIAFKPLKVKVPRRPPAKIKRPVLPKPVLPKFKKPRVKLVKKKVVSKGFTEFTSTVVKPKLSKEEKRTRGILLGGVELFTGAELRGEK